MKSIEIGRLLRAGITGCVVGCKVSNMSAPTFGQMICIPLDANQVVFGLIHDIHVDDDGLVRQLITAGNIRPEVIDDNRINRNTPAEISVLFIGYDDGERIFHMLPPRPPLSLDVMVPCSDQQMVAFTNTGRFGYFRHILRAVELPVVEILSAHLRVAGLINRRAGKTGWIQDATRELITLLRDDYTTLNTVLNALGDLDMYHQG
jgi:hypothetical protein